MPNGRVLVIVATSAMLFLAAVSRAQQPAPQRPGGQVPGDQQRPPAQRPPAPKRPTPRWADGHVNLGSTDAERGLWERRGEHLVVNPQSYQANATRNARVHIDQVPLQPWARALTNYRHSLALASEPYTRCKPAGGPRQFMSPYGLEVAELPDLKRVYVFNISNAQSYRTIYMDVRTHPANLEPTYLGHSIGRWDGDTLVIDTVGFSEDFWMNRDGLPHTSQLHLVERLTRPDFDTLTYDVTIDDPGAYTAPWTSGYTLGWQKGLELFEYSCQENNISPESMAGDNLRSAFIP
jgi:hypothetical protein